MTIFAAKLDNNENYISHSFPISCHLIGGGDNHGDFMQMEPNAPIGLWPDLQYVGEVERHRNGAEPNDDLTMLCLRVS